MSTLASSTGATGMGTSVVTTMAGAGAASTHTSGLDFDVWDGDIPPASAAALLHAETEKDLHSNVTTRRDKQLISGGVKGADPLHDADRGSAADPLRDADKISAADSVSDVTPPPPNPPQQAGNFPQINPFTTEWFAQLIGAAATAAASAAVANSASAGQPQSQPMPQPQTGAQLPDPSAPRRLNDRKVPDFWEDRPEFWFRIFDAHLAHFTPTEMKCFDALLPLLTPAARAVVYSVIRSPGNQPYSKARQALLRHFGQTPRQMARDLRDGNRSLGEKLPTEFLDHVRGLVQDFNIFLEVVLLDALPKNARDAALQQDGVDAMASAADLVVLENRAAAMGLRDGAVNSIDASFFEDVAPVQPAPPLQAHASVAAVSKDMRPQPKDLCFIHSRWGKDAYKCASPRFCRMKSIIRPRPPQPTSSGGQRPSGNGPAGGQH